MSAWLSRLRHAWAALSAAPIALAIAIVVPAAVTWAAVDWSWRSALAERHAEIARLTAEVSAYRDPLGGASPEQAAGEIRSLRVALAATKKELADLQSPDRDPNAVYQHGQRVGIVDGAEIDSANKSVTFQRMTADRELDQATNLDFRDLVIGFKGYAALTRTAQSRRVIYHSAHFAVVGHRQGDCADPAATGNAED